MPRKHRLAENDLSAHLIAAGFKCIAFPLVAPRTKPYCWADETWTREKGMYYWKTFRHENLRSFENCNILLTFISTNRLKAWTRKPQSRRRISGCLIAEL